MILLALFLVLALPAAAQPGGPAVREAAAAWVRAQPGPGPQAPPYAGWSQERAEAMRGLNRRFCGNLRLSLPGPAFPFADDASCVARQEALLPRLCDEAGASRARPQSACFAAVNRDMREGLNRLAALAEAAAPRHATHPLPLPPRPGPAPPRDIPATEIFAANQASTWRVIVEAGIPGRGPVQGSAVAVGPRHVLTNCHVVRAGAAIRLVRGRDSLPASVSAMDLEGDRCVLQTEADRLTPIRHLRPHGDLRVGERIYAIGAPLGLELTLTEGILSALRSRGGIALVQSSATVAPGSSGGGLYDARGNLIGITTFGVGRQGGLEFAIAPEGFWTIPLLVAAR
ncbi:serine protease [Roseococcus sp. SDR]|uniref:S1C family serine protease n=1 Tax=Roseococcus sp. SDR TaxID=2835532 RepID=UPI001BCC6C98|nr:serine protease [Roseococcus sp. SDR]MBS7790984.1 trypsin-like peptidase domain-containing protein [Roseococcus sp. SDR]MBV1846298.1 serine protease [Roseococcus sp. SDR]